MIRFMRESKSRLITCWQKEIIWVHLCLILVLTNCLSPGIESVKFSFIVPRKTIKSTLLRYLLKLKVILVPVVQELETFLLSFHLKWEEVNVRQVVVVVQVQAKVSRSQRQKWGKCMWHKAEKDLQVQTASQEVDKHYLLNLFLSSKIMRSTKRRLKSHRKMKDLLIYCIWILQELQARGMKVVKTTMNTQLSQNLVVSILRS